MNSRIVCVLLFFVICCSITCVSASDLNETQQMEEIMASDSSSDVLNSEEINLNELNENAGSSADNGTFQALQDKINAASQGATIYLYNNYTYDDSFTKEGVMIQNPITIEGNGFAIDGLGKSKIFNVNASSNIIINNITFKNGNGDYGSAVCYLKEIENTKITNCNFYSNTAKDNGGAICFMLKCSNSIISKCDFISNHGDMGGAIYIGMDYEETPNINNNFTHLSFINNTADTGGAIYVLGLVQNNLFYNVSFINSSVKHAGGAIFFAHDVYGCEFSLVKFISNAARTGGGICCHGHLTETAFRDMQCINNTATYDYGGFIFVEYPIEYCIFNRIDFINNSAKLRGGVICSNLVFASNELINLSFINNGAERGGAIFSIGDFADNALNNCIFAKNHALNGSAIYFQRYMIYNRIGNLIFIDNTAEDTGTFYIYGISDEYILSSKFINNMAKNAAAIYFNGPCSSNLENCEFINNTCDVSNICFMDESELTIRDCIFDGKNSILILNKYSDINLINNSELNSYSNSYFALNNGVISLNNNSLRNIIYNKGTVSSKTHIYVLAMLTLLDPVKLFAYCVDDRGNYIVSDNMTFHINEDNLTVPMGYNPIAYADYVMTQKATLKINASLSSRLSDCDYYTSILRTVLLDAEDMVRGFNSNYDYQVKLTDSNGNPIGNESITFTVAGKQYGALTDNNGIASIRLGLDVGEYKVTVSSPLIEQDITRNLKIEKRILNNKDLNVYYNSNQKFKIQIIGDDGKAEGKGKSVDVTIDNKKSTLKTDADGFITITINKNIKPGTHNIKIEYNGFSVKNKITVKHSLSSKKIVTVKKSAKKIVLKAKLKSNYKNKIIKFKIKGKTYKAKTNKKGIAKLTIKNKFKKGKYSVKITYLNDIVKTTLKIK